MNYLDLIKMKIDKLKLSAIQKLQYITLRDLPEDYAILTIPDDCSLEIKGQNIMVRKK